jgi:predicted phage tail protein
MFCPNCAAQNVDGASFCRVCGANISLVPQAISGAMSQRNENEPAEISERAQRRKARREPGLEQSMKNLFMGFAFLLVALALAYSSRGWWFWMLIPAFSMMGSGVAQIIRFKEREKQTLKTNAVGRPAFQPQTQVNAFPTRATGELVPPPPSVTEGTTRHLGAEAPTRHLDE